MYNGVSVKKPWIKWDNKYQTGYKRIDDQHKDKEQRRQEPEENDDIIPRIEQHPDVLRK